MKRFACLGFVIFISAACSATGLEIRLQKINNTKGQILVGVFKHDSDFPDIQSAFVAKKLNPKIPKVTVLFEDLPEGRYAVAVFHDANLNGRLDKNFMGIPREGFGFSLDAAARFGPPAFKAAGPGKEDARKYHRVSQTRLN